MSRVDLTLLRKLLVGPGGEGEAGEYLWPFMGPAAKGRPTLATGKAALQLVLQKLLIDGRWGDAGVLLWGQEVFNPQPWSVAQIIAQWKRSKKNLILGAGSMGKTFSVAALTYLDWRVDPCWTAVKIISQTKQHAKTNMFATLRRLHQDAAIPLPTVPGESWIRVNGQDDRHGIMQVSIPKGESGLGVLKGFHPVPRNTPHVRLGRMSRVRAVIDEGEHVPVGVWTGADNMLLSIAPDSDDLRVTCVTNPVDVTSEFARRAEHEKGWGKTDPDVDVTWGSTSGYDVLRLDAKMTENVKTGRVVFPGFQTASGYSALVQANGGADTVGVWTLGRGMYPRTGATSGVFPPGLVDRANGGYVWIGMPTPVAGFDTALEGNDDAVLTVGVCGFASHWKTPDGTETAFGEPRQVLLAQQQITFPKGAPMAMASEVKRTCTALRVEPHAFAMDSTGIGERVEMHLRHEWGDVLGLMYSLPASDRKVIAEDPLPASERYSTVATELFFAASAWAEHNLLKIDPGCMSARLQAELAARRYRIVAKGRVALRKKEEDQVRGKSPDFADSLTLLVEAARRVLAGNMTTGATLPGRQPTPERTARDRAAERLERISWVTDEDQNHAAGVDMSGMWEGD